MRVELSVGLAEEGGRDAEAGGEAARRSRRLDRAGPTARHGRRRPRRSCWLRTRLAQISAWLVMTCRSSQMRGRRQTLASGREQAAGLEHLAVGARQAAAAAVRCPASDCAPRRRPSRPRSRPSAATKPRMPGQADLRKAHADLAAPEAGREGLGDHAGDAEVAHGAHRRIVRMAVAEIVGRRPAGRPRCTVGCEVRDRRTASPARRVRPRR